MLQALGEGARADPLDRIVQAGAASVDDPPDGGPERVGPYRLVREIGRGGMATVYLAEREGDYSRRVAVKLIRRGLDTDDILTRLRLERQILAHLDHPYIARMFEGGTTEDGRPYFVMEAIEGQRIDHWCAEHELSLEERLVLFRKVCEAVDYAHQNLVLHRDIKPSNLLVTEDGTPKLLDFGIAKVLRGAGGEDEDSGSLSATPTLTAPDERLLTPEFASPEQVRGEGLTTGSDVYSLGVLLYGLITGQQPYELDRRRLEDVTRVVCEVQPERPSAKIRRAAKLGEPVPVTWPRGSRAEDLDNIVLTALRKEPYRRYGSARQLAEDLRCFRADLPITARKDTLRYRTAKFIRRNRSVVAGVSALFLMLTAGVGITSHQAKIARQERAFAEEQQIKAESIAGFLQDVLRSSNPDVALGEEISLRRVLDQARGRIETELQSSPLIRAELMLTMASAYLSLTGFDEAEALFQGAVSIYRRQGPSAERRLTHALVELARLFIDREEAYRAKVMAREAAVRLGRLDPGSSSHAEALGWLALSLSRNGELGRADTLFKDLDAWAEEAADDRIKAHVLNVLGEHLILRGLPTEAMTYLQESLDIRSRLLPENHPLVLESKSNLSMAEGALSRGTGLVEHYADILEQKRRLYGERSGSLVKALNNLGVALRRSERAEEAIDAFYQALDIGREAFGETHRSTARSHRGLALCYRMLQKHERAMKHAERALEIDRRRLRPNDPEVVRSLFLVAEMARILDLPTAEDQLLEVVRIRRQSPSEARLDLATALLGLGRLYLSRGRAADAEPPLRECLDLRGAKLSPENPRVSQVQGELGRSLLEQGRHREAETLLTTALEHLTERFGPEHVRTVVVQGYLDRLRAEVD